MNDLISRQAAIDAIAHATFDVTIGGRRGFIDYKKAFEKAFVAIRDKYIEALEALPSAQPERTCVNCGRTVNNGGWYADGRTRCPIEEHYALPKDGYCHLWEKSVTDDDYPERRTDGRD